MIRFVTAGESHGSGVFVIVEGIPAGLTVNQEDIDIELAKRQSGFGRGKRMNIEADHVTFLSGIRYAKTIGSPIAMCVSNKDSKNWTRTMSVKSIDFDKATILSKPRPGHADLAGLIKFGASDFRDILERASARETVARVAAGSICKLLLSEFKMKIMSYTVQIGTAVANITSVKKNDILRKTEKSSVRCPDDIASTKMVELIKIAEQNGDTLGGKFKIIVDNVPIGLGSHTQWDLKLDGRIAKSLISIQAIKAVEFGEGIELASLFGSISHDEIFYGKYNNEFKLKKFYRNTNMAGGIEGGISNGEPIVVTCTMKAIPSLKKPLQSVNLNTKQADKAEIVRSDVCAVPAAGVVAESAIAIEIAKALKEKFGGDCLDDMKKNINVYMERLKVL
ncbi:MAG: chorismate synthase [Endomicrobium sp.]|jgi:chorismate synthase|nr:chorismate synthase [Endomicrobium sp.]